ncbi:MAG TPA: hypothetical protein VFP99_02755 [Chthoniobacterales bacterium]|nr:hypothetical protein [Chthoniobacterales bacterium]
MREDSPCLELALEIKPAIQRAKCDMPQHIASVITRQDFAASADAVWNALMFYEEVEESLLLVLRAFLPIPIGSQGCKSQVGNEIKCRYISGHLLKRVTQIVHGCTYSFEVIEQSLALRRGIKLLGGDYTLRKLSEDRTRVALTTRYQTPSRSLWFHRWFETAVCHSFHRHILGAIQTNVRRASHRKQK